MGTDSNINILDIPSDPSWQKGHFPDIVKTLQKQKAVPAFQSLLSLMRGWCVHRFAPSLFTSSRLTSIDSQFLIEAGSSPVIPSLHMIIIPGRGIDRTQSRCSNSGLFGSGRRILRVFHWKDPGCR